MTETSNAVMTDDHADHMDGLMRRTFYADAGLVFWGMFKVWSVTQAACAYLRGAREIKAALDRRSVTCYTRDVEDSVVQYFDVSTQTKRGQLNATNHV
ncbi:hypothetical protein JRO89_XS15G0140600 [Xanthoceras sorbifolium]|uniref:Uncharacterized protein n=1 Tax=Xanthoceras sorbifolium TaxID=99658 RepID=A0ABQ8H249_9ROSI|nr:hypothetical protein JRO89_XS15G0140600 [Xanthoceras sorbifolium]